MRSVSSLEHLALGERAPGLGGDAVLGVPGAQLGLLEQRVELDLVDRRQRLGLAPRAARGPRCGSWRRRSSARRPRRGSVRRRARCRGRGPRSASASGSGRGRRGRGRAARGSCSKAARVESKPCSEFQSLVVTKISSRARPAAAIAGADARARCGRRRRCRCGGSRPRAPSSTTRWVSSGGTWKTPKPSCGISTPSLQPRRSGRRPRRTALAGGEADGDQREGEHDAQVERPSRRPSAKAAACASGRRR